MAVTHTVVFLLWYLYLESWGLVYVTLKHPFLHWVYSTFPQSNLYLLCLEQQKLQKFNPVPFYGGWLVPAEIAFEFAAVILNSWVWKKWIHSEAKKVTVIIESNFNCETIISHSWFSQLRLSFRRRASKGLGRRFNLATLESQQVVCTSWLKFCLVVLVLHFS